MDDWNGVMKKKGSCDYPESSARFGKSFIFTSSESYCIVQLVHDGIIKRFSYFTYK